MTTKTYDDFDVATWHKNNLVRTLQEQLKQAEALGQVALINTIQKNLRDALCPNTTQIETPESRAQTVANDKIDALQQAILTKDGQIAELTLKNQRLLDENAQLRANLAALTKRQPGEGFAVTPMGVFVMD